MKELELEINLGKINPIPTDLYLRGGDTVNPGNSSAPLHTRPVGYSGDVDTSPFRIAFILLNCKKISISNLARSAGRLPYT